MMKLQHKKIIMNKSNIHIQNSPQIAAVMSKLPGNHINQNNIHCKNKFNPQHTH